VALGRPDWSDDSHSLALTVELQPEGLLVHLIVNAFWEPLDFELPPLDGVAEGTWRRWIDTSRDSPQDIVDWEAAPSLGRSGYRAEARSIVVLFAYKASAATT